MNEGTKRFLRKISNNNINNKKQKWQKMTANLRPKYPKVPASSIKPQFHKHWKLSPPPPPPHIHTYTHNQGNKQRKYSKVKRLCCPNKNYFSDFSLLVFFGQQSANVTFVLWHFGLPPPPLSPVYSRNTCCYNPGQNCWDISMQFSVSRHAIFVSKRNKFAPLVQCCFGLTAQVCISCKREGGKRSSNLRR